MKINTYYVDPVKFTVEESDLVIGDIKSKEVEGKHFVMGLKEGYKWSYRGPKQELGLDNTLLNVLNKLKGVVTIGYYKLGTYDTVYVGKEIHNEKFKSIMKKEVDSFYKEYGHGWGDCDKYEDGDDTYEDRMIFVQEHPFLIRAVESVDGTGICVSGLSRDNRVNSGGSGSYGISKEDFWNGKGNQAVIFAVKKAIKDFKELGVPEDKISKVTVNFDFCVLLDYDNLKDYKIFEGIRETYEKDNTYEVIFNVVAGDENPRRK